MKWYDTLHMNLLLSIPPLFMFEFHCNGRTYLPGPSDATSGFFFVVGVQFESALGFSSFLMVFYTFSGLNVISYFILSSTSCVWIYVTFFPVFTMPLFWI